MRSEPKYGQNNRAAEVQQELNAVAGEVAVAGATGRPCPFVRVSEAGHGNVADSR